jgi:hypothetical protein
MKSTHEQQIQSLLQYKEKRIKAQDTDDSFDASTRGSINLSALEKHIETELKSCDLWSEMKFSQEEYQDLTDQIKLWLGSEKKIEDFNRLLSVYPLCCVTQIVFYVFYHYQDEFWGPWAENLGLRATANHQREIGQKVLKIFQKQRFSYDEEGYRYVTPILCMVGIPYAHLVDLFEVVDAEKQQVFDPVTLVNELLEWKSSFIHKTVWRYIENYREKAISLLLDVDEIIRNPCTGVVNAQDDRLATRYEEWKREKEDKGHERKTERAYPTPDLVFFDDERGLCVHLPSVISQNEYSSEVRWVIIPEGQPDKKRDVSRKYLRDADGLSTQEMYISIPAASSYQFRLYDNIELHKPLKEGTIPGFMKSFLLFNGRGRRIRDDCLPDDEGYLLFFSDIMKDPIFESLNYKSLALPLQEKQCKAWYFAVESENAAVALTLGDERKVIRLRSHVKIKLAESGFLFGENPSFGTMPVYTSFPALDIGSANANRLKVTILHRQTGFKVTEKASHCVSDPGKLDIVSLVRKDDVSQAPYGTFDVRIYEGNSYINKFEFAYVPNIKYSKKPLKPWPTSNSRFETTGFDFSCPKDVDIKITNDAQISRFFQRNEEWTSVRSNRASIITGTLSCHCDAEKSSQAVINWAKKVRYFDWSLHDEFSSETIVCQETQILEDAQMKNSRLWISLWFNSAEIDSQPVLQLRKSAKILQEVKVSPRHDGKWAIPLDVFTTTLEDTNLPVDFVLTFIAEENEHNVVLIRLTEAIIFPDLSYRVLRGLNEKRIPTLFWSARSAVPDVSVVIRGVTEPDYRQNISPCEKKKTKDHKSYGLYLKEELPPGLYKLEPAVEEDNFFFENTEGYKPPLLQEQNILKIGSVAQEEWVHTLSGILKCLLFYSGDTKALKQFEQLTGQQKVIEVDITENVCKLFVCLIYNFDSASGGENSRIVMRAVDALNVHQIEEKQRAKLAQWILSYPLPLEQLQLCSKRLNFFLSAMNPEISMGEEELRRIGDFNQWLELLWRLRLNKRKGLCQKLVSFVGLDIWGKMIVFEPRPQCGKIQWRDCLEKTLEGKCSCAQVVLPEELCGHSKDFWNMFVWEGKHIKEPFLDLTKRTQGGTRFCGQTYVDLLIMWYQTMTARGLSLNDLTKKLQPLRRELDVLKDVLLSIDSILASDYFEKMNGRELDRKSLSFYSLFYYTAIAALASAFVSLGRLTSEQYKPARLFLVEMMEIFPELVKRDLLLCEILIFLKRGETACR